MINDLLSPYLISFDTIGYPISLEDPPLAIMPKYIKSLEFP